MKNKIAAMAVQVKELTKEVEKWKHKYQETKQVYNRVQRELDTVRQEKQQLQDVSDRYDRVVRVLGENVVEDAVQKDIQEQKDVYKRQEHIKHRKVGGSFGFVQPEAEFSVNLINVKSVKVF